MPTVWNFDPIVILGLLVLIGGYWALVGPLRRRLGEPQISLARRAAFVGGWALLALTLLSPLDAIGRTTSLTARTLQILLITSAAAPLLLTGIPEWTIWRLLPVRAWRDALRSPLFSFTAAFIFNVLTLFWYIPAVLDASLRNEAVHDLSSAVLLIAGLLTWWPMLTPLDHDTRLASPLQMFYIAVESLPLDFLGLAMMFVGTVFYPIYTNAALPFGLSPLVDQQIAGGLLVIPFNIIDLIFMSVAFFGWIARIERAQHEREMAEIEAEAQREAAHPAETAAQPNAQ